METNELSEGQGAVVAIGEGDLAKMDIVTKRISVKPSTIAKMKKISSLFADEPGFDPKETEMIAFFLEVSFDAYLKSGVVEERLKGLML